MTEVLAVRECGSCTSRRLPQRQDGPRAATLDFQAAALIPYGSLLATLLINFIMNIVLSFYFRALSIISGDFKRKKEEERKE